MCACVVAGSISVFAGHFEYQDRSERVHLEGNVSNAYVLLGKPEIGEQITSGMATWTEPSYLLKWILKKYMWTPL
jgi:hypothetical protein